MAFRLPKGGAVPRDPSRAPGRIRGRWGALANAVGEGDPRSRKEALGADTTISSNTNGLEASRGQVLQKEDDRFRASDEAKTVKISLTRNLEPPGAQLLEKIIVCRARGRQRPVFCKKAKSGGSRGPLPQRKSQFLTLVPRPGPEGTWLSLQTWKRYEDKGARCDSDTKGT